VVLPMFAAIGSTIMGLLLSLVAIFIILLVLVQRGRGGGLAGALGGMGGSSAFGAKAGDVFTKITVGAAAVWILLCIAASRLGTSSQSLLDLPDAPPASTSGDSVNAEPASKTGPAEGNDAATAAPAASDAAPAASEAAAPAEGDAPKAAE
jgi:preprotein translocase subunit SecG